MMEVVLTAFHLKKGEGHKTLVDRFAYPLQGTGQVYEKMAEAIRQRGGHIRVASPVDHIVFENGAAKGIALVSRPEEPEYFDQVISTMPFTDAIGKIPNLPGNVRDILPKLRYRNTTMVFLNVEGKDLFEDNWLYVHSENLQMGRVTNFRNWIPELYGQSENTILVLEYWSYDQDDFWKLSDHELIDLAKREIRSTGLVRDCPIPDGYVYRVHRSYPTYHKGYKKDLEIVEEFASRLRNIQFIGRYGAFKYNNQDHSLLMGILAAENLDKNAGHNLWKVNTDYDTYQENTLITETGLENR